MAPLVFESFLVLMKLVMTAELFRFPPPAALLVELSPSDTVG
jgi:hypothetical protein